MTTLQEIVETMETRYGRSNRIWAMDSSYVKTLTVHRNTVMRHMVAFGTDCLHFMDLSFANLHLRHIEIDEIWTLVRKKQGKYSGLSAGYFTWKQQGLPGSWGTPISICSWYSTPVGRQAAHQKTVVARLPLKRKRKLQREFLFRGSIAWLLDSLSTLRSAGYPDATQDSLPAAG